MKEIKYSPFKDWWFWGITIILFLIESFRFISTENIGFQIGQFIGTLLGSMTWAIFGYTIIYLIKKGLASRKKR